MPTLTILNGPPGSGKDHIADALVLERPYLIKVEFKEKIKEIVMVLFGLTEEEHDLYYQRENKELPQEKLGGRSIRQAYIFVSEVVIKPNFGKDYFGHAVASKLQPGKEYICSDGGFIEEILPCKERCKQLNIVHLFAEGCDFEESGDSRRYIVIEDQKVVTHKVINDFTDNPIQEIKSKCL